MKKRRKMINVERKCEKKVTYEKTKLIKEEEMIQEDLH